MRKFITTLITVIVVATLQAQQQNPPKLVVCITIDQLRGDYLEFFKPSFGERGFKRLFNDGVVFNHVQFEFSNIDYASSFATLFTGSNPCFHSITGIKRYDFNMELERSCLYDAAFLGNNTHLNFSPKNLLCSTIGDELKNASKGISKVYAIAPNPESAILSAGHFADGVFWLDDYNGKWATTTYYKKDLPPFVDKLNSNPESLSARLPSIIWTPMLTNEQYGALPYITEKKQFRYTFNEREVGCYPRFKTSAYVNQEVGKLATAFINDGNLGGQATSDLLCVTFYGGNFLDVQDIAYTQEVQDTYFQLDQSIAELLDAIDKKVGLNKTFIVVTGTGYYTDAGATADGEFAVGGIFNKNLCTALLNAELRRVYGIKDWVNGYYNQQIFLNRKTIEDENVDLMAIQNKAAELVAKFSGVQQVVTDHILRNGDWNEGSAMLRYGTYHDGRGDLIIELKPGWGIEDEISGKKVQVKRNNVVMTPLFFLGNSLKPKHIERSVYATEIAPTVTNMLRIRAPNGCGDLPLGIRE